MLKEKEELLQNGWMPTEHPSKYTKDRFTLSHSEKNYIAIIDESTMRYYGKFPLGNLKLIEELVCW